MTVDPTPLEKWFPSAEFDTDEAAWFVELREGLEAEISVIVDVGEYRDLVSHDLRAQHLCMDYTCWFINLLDDNGQEQEFGITMANFFSAYDWANQQEAETRFYDGDDLHKLAGFIMLLWKEVFERKVGAFGLEIGSLLSGFELFNHGLD